MRNNFVTINDIKYIQIGLIEIKQKGKSFYVGKINTKDLLNIYTVRPCVYDVEKNSSMAKSFPNEKDYYDHLIAENKATISDKDFQRKYSEERINKIKSFLNKEEYAFFPNTIIANCDLINDVENFDIDEENNIDDLSKIENIPSHLSFHFKENGIDQLLIPYLKDSILIIDGQHRVEGLKKSDIEVISNYELLIAFIIGYDRSVIAQQFYTINYEQKPVNKSLLYHLMGEFSTDLDELTFVHKVVKALNELEQSPFYKRIKMLGVTPTDLNPEDKKQLSISLAFLIDALIKSMSKSASIGMYQPIFRYYYKNEEYQIEIIRFLMKYFNAVEDLVENWDSPTESLVSKGMGVGALIKTLQLIFPKIFIVEWNKDPTMIKTYTKENIVENLKGLENVDFSKDGPFGKIGSAGSINKIKESIVENVKYFSCDNYENFEVEFKKEKGYLMQYKKWLDDNL